MGHAAVPDLLLRLASILPVVAIALTYAVVYVSVSHNCEQ